MLRRPIVLPALTLTLLVLARLLTGGLTDRSAAASDSSAPRVEVDPFWPKPLPNNWLMGQAAGVATDRHDHVWVIQRPKSLTEDERGATLNPPRSRCCAPAPPVLEFDADGALLQSWGGPGSGYTWPENEHGIFVDGKDNVWVAGGHERQGLRQPRALREAVARRLALRVRPEEQPHPGLSQGRHVRQGVRRRGRDARQRIDVGRGPLSRRHADGPLQRRRREQP